VPGDKPKPIAGLPVRKALSLDSLPDLVKELGIQQRLDQITTWGLEKKILPPMWPFMPVIGLWDQGGPLEKVGIQDALLRAIDFKQVLARDLPGTERIAFTVTPLGQRMLDAYSLPYDRAAAKDKLAAAYPAGFVVYVVHPKGDRLLALMAERIAGQLAEVGLGAKVVPVAVSQMDSFLKDTLALDVVTLWLLRR
jgi:hypothetical protein